jgi:hypothetical protein
VPVQKEKVVPGESASGLSDAVARALCEFAALPLVADRVSLLTTVLDDVLERRSALMRLDLTDVEPAAAFDARWE